MRQSNRIEASPGAKAQTHAAQPNRVRARSSWLAATALALVVALSSAPAVAEEYESGDSGHPLRLVAYLLHPVGVVLDYVIMRPAYWVGSHQPFKTLFGHED